MSRRDFPNFKDFSAKVHNIHVKRAIKELTANKNGLANKRIQDLYKTALITKSDTAQLILLKQMFFWFDLGYLNKKIDSTASIPESWNAKRVRNIPQLVVVYRKLKKSRSGSYQITIPHYDGTRNPQGISYTKGNHVGTLVLKDGSFFVVNAISPTEVERVINFYKRYINTKYLSTDLRLSIRKGKPLAKDEYRPIRADYYPRGQDDDYPKWQHYLN